VKRGPDAERLVAERVEPFVMVAEPGSVML
jgi:hypothetical protein